ncbi:MAG: hypothetical protein SGJ11_08325 [Phycisphaerae bacterium]|nr:hypothetical protein [Phycisphaerae bacterium]
MILAGVSATDLGAPRQGQLRRYVEDAGGGVLVIGNHQGLARDWLDTPLEPNAARRASSA